VLNINYLVVDSRAVHLQVVSEGRSTPQVVAEGCSTPRVAVVAEGSTPQVVAEGCRRVVVVAGQAA